MVEIPFINDGAIKLDSYRFYEEKKKYELTHSWADTPSTQEMEQMVKKPLQERVMVLREEGNYTVYQLDGYLNIRGYSDAYREAQKKIWVEQARVLCKRWKGCGAALLLSLALYHILEVKNIWRFQLPPIEGRNIFNRSAIPCIFFIALMVFLFRWLRACTLTGMWSTPPYEVFARVRTEYYRIGRLDPLLDQLMGNPQYQHVLHQIEKNHLSLKQIRPLTPEDKRRRFFAKILPILEQIERRFFSLM